MLHLYIVFSTLSVMISKGTILAVRLACAYAFACELLNIANLYAVDFVAMVF